MSYIDPRRNLVKRGTSEIVEEGAEVVSFRGNKGTLHSSSRPHKPASTGRVYVAESDDDTAASAFPSVYDLEFITDEELIKRTRNEEGFDQ